MGDDITEEEKRMWEETPPKQDEIPAKGMLAWAGRRPFTAEDKCVLFGGNAAGEPVWMEDNCLGKKAYFICSVEQRKRSDQKEKLEKEMMALISQMITKKKEDMHSSYP